MSPIVITFSFIMIYQTPKFSLTQCDNHLMIILYGTHIKIANKQQGDSCESPCLEYLCTSIKRGFLVSESDCVQGAHISLKRIWFPGNDIAGHSIWSIKVTRCPVPEL